MTSMTRDLVRVVGGIDTHKDLHMAVVVDRDDGQLLAIKEFSTTRAGYRALLRWMRSFGGLDAVGIEGTGSYGAGVARFLSEAYPPNTPNHSTGPAPPATTRRQPATTPHLAPAT